MYIYRVPRAPKPGAVLCRRLQRSVCDSDPVESKISFINAHMSTTRAAFPGGARRGGHRRDRCSRHTARDRLVRGGCTRRPTSDVSSPDTVHVLIAVRDGGHGRPRAADKVPATTNLLLLACRQLYSCPSAAVGSCPNENSVCLSVWVCCTARYLHVWGQIGGCSGGCLIWWFYIFTSRGPLFTPRYIHASLKWCIRL